jgi:hypothetical protein
VLICAEKTTCQSGAYRVLVGRPEGNMQLATSRLRWKDNFKMGL